MTDCLREIRGQLPHRFERRFETAPGRQAQVDFAAFMVEFTDQPGVRRKVWLFSCVRGNSRWLWGRFCPSQKLETVLRCHIMAFEAAGGIPSAVRSGSSLNELPKAKRPVSSQLPGLTPRRHLPRTWLRCITNAGKSRPPTTKSKPRFSGPVPCYAASDLHS